MNANRSDYLPINCEFHDLLEDLAVTRKAALISFRDGSGETQRRSTTIRDVYARDGAEYLAMSTGEVVRLDQLVEVAGAKLADYPDMACQLD
jgi:Rho-binding antiterminator